MSGLEPNPGASPADLACLKDAELTGVNVWQYGVTLSFNHRPLIVTIESNAEFQAQGRAEVFQQEVIVAFGARMLSLIGSNVVEVSINTGKMLTLLFTDGSKVTLRPDATGNESYSVNLPDGSLFIG
jgi:hypothetical protein